MIEIIKKKIQIDAERKRGERQKKAREAPTSLSYRPFFLPKYEMAFNFLA